MEQDENDKRGANTGGTITVQLAYLVQRRFCARVPTALYVRGSHSVETLRML